MALAGKPGEVIRVRVRGKHLKKPKRKYEGRRVSWVYSEAAKWQTRSTLPEKQPGKRGRRPDRSRASAVVKVVRDTGEQRATAPLQPALPPLLIAQIPSLGFSSSAGTQGLPQDTWLLRNACESDGIAASPRAAQPWHGWGYAAEAGGPPGYGQAHGASGVWFLLLSAFLGILPSELGRSTEV